LTTFYIFFILMVVASFRNKYYGTNFISAVPTSLLIAPGLRTIQFLFFSPATLLLKKKVTPPIPFVPPLTCSSPYPTLYSFHYGPMAVTRTVQQFPFNNEFVYFLNSGRCTNILIIRRKK
jgi:hypothetical protein